MRAPFRRLRLATLLAGCVLAARSGEPAPRPLNLLLVTADDLNADSAGWMGSPVPATPHLDGLARASHRFVNAHLTASVCVPSRAALLTGRVPHRSGALGFGPVAGDVPTLVEVLRRRGYVTAAIDKLSHMRPAAKFPWDLALHGAGRAPARMGAAVARCLARARRTGRPFFVDANITDPHRPFLGSRLDRWPSGAAARREHAVVRGWTRRAGGALVPGVLEDLPPVRRELARYYASVARMDESLGAVLAALDAAGHTDDTVVVFLSDNGMSVPFAKATLYRDGTWSPVLLRYPGMPPPAVHDEMVSSVDVMPTLLELLDVTPPPGMDGRSWGPLLRSEAQGGRDHVVTHVNGVHSGADYPQRCVRSRTRSLMFQPWADGRRRFHVEAMNGLTFPALVVAARHDAAIAARVRQYVFGVPLALYDLESDPDERHNLIGVPAYGPDVEQLAGLLGAHMERTGDPQLEAFRAAIAGWRHTHGPD
jgi:N-sulfoglucosamine sulfohydrolase